MTKTNPSHRQSSSKLIPSISYSPNISATSFMRSKSFNTKIQNLQNQSSPLNLISVLKISKTTFWKSVMKPPLKATLLKDINTEFMLFSEKNHPLNSDYSHHPTVSSLMMLWIQRKKLQSFLAVVFWGIRNSRKAMSYPLTANKKTKQKMSMLSSLMTTTQSLTLWNFLLTFLVLHWMREWKTVRKDHFQFFLLGQSVNYLK